MIIAVEGAAKSVSTMYRAEPSANTLSVAASLAAYCVCRPFDVRVDTAGPAHSICQGAASLNRAWMLGMGPAEPSGVDYIGAFLPRAHLLLGLLI